MKRMRHDASRNGHGGVTISSKEAYEPNYGILDDTQGTHAQRRGIC